MTIAALLPLAGTRDATAQPGSADTQGAEATMTLHRSGVVPRCWNEFIHEHPEAGSARFRIAVSVRANGSVETVRVLDPVPVPLQLCVRGQLSQLRFAAGVREARATYSFQAGTPAPVPTPRGD